MFTHRASRRLAARAGLAVLALGASHAGADTVSIATFEGGLPPGWTVTPDSWTVGGTTGTSPNIFPPQGVAFARCGAPNVTSGVLAEQLTGTMTSAPLTVRAGTMQWVACGWSGQFGNGVNRFEILDASMAVVATVPAPLSDSWTLQSVNLIQAGLAMGGTFYFRAVDGRADTTYSWLAVDDMMFVGPPCPADLNGSGVVDGADLGLLLANWGAAGTGDLNGSGAVDGADLGALLAAWGPCAP
jgi:hypothetical protein